MNAEVALSYPALLVDGRFSQHLRDHQYNEAYKNGLPFFIVEIVPDKNGTDQKMMHLQGEMVMGTGLFRAPEAIKAFLIDK
ncbi:MAG: hypothetical protein LRY40_06500, partial [Shewanella fodinae]|nr:hypothetical protein [Shewanella fodinae]